MEGGGGGFKNENRKSANWYFLTVIPYVKAAVCANNAIKTNSFTKLAIIRQFEKLFVESAWVLKTRNLGGGGGEGILPRNHSAIFI